MEIEEVIENIFAQAAEITEVIIIPNFRTSKTASSPCKHLVGERGRTSQPMLS
jgi:hypothetical protein